MRFKLEITCDNAAFCDTDQPGENDSAANMEVARILRTAAKHIENGCAGRPLCDVNGNRVGAYDFTE